MSTFIRRKPLGRRFHAVYWKACCGKSNLPGSAEVLTKTETLKKKQTKTQTKKNKDRTEAESSKLVRKVGNIVCLGHTLLE